MFLRGAEPVEKFGLLGIGETLAVEVACDQVADMSVCMFIYSIHGSAGRTPTFPAEKIPIRPKRSGELQPAPQLPAVSVPDLPRYR